MPHPCHDCQKEFATAEALGHHRKSKHGEQPKKPSFRLKRKHAIPILIILIILSLGLWSHYKSNLPGQHDALAQCLTEKGMKFYGSFQCSHCLNVKKLFGKSLQYINYIECGALGAPQAKACEDAGVKNYPTFTFADGSIIEGEQGEATLQTLAKKTGCSA